MTAPHDATHDALHDAKVVVITGARGAIEIGRPREDGVGFHFTP